MTTENYTGSDCTLTNGDVNRELTLSNTALTVDSNFIVVVDTFALNQNVDFSVAHQSTNSVITFLNKIWDTQKISVNYSTSGSSSEGQSQGTTGVLPLDTQFLINEIHYFGNNVTVRAVTNDSYSKWGDVTETTSDDVDVKAIVNILTKDDSEVREGIFQSGDIRFIFKSNQADLTRGNRIKFNGLWYQIYETHETFFGDIQYAIEVLAKKV